jgi:hypothetical protein
MGAGRRGRREFVKLGLEQHLRLLEVRLNLGREQILGLGQGLW